jgi:hypothetical protein
MHNLRNKVEVLTYFLINGVRRKFLTDKKKSATEIQANFVSVTKYRNHRNIQKQRESISFSQVDIAFLLLRLAYLL